MDGQSDQAVGKQGTGKFAIDRVFGIQKGRTEHEPVAGNAYGDLLGGCFEVFHNLDGSLGGGEYDLVPGRVSAHLPPYDIHLIDEVGQKSGVQAGLSILVVGMVRQSVPPWQDVEKG
jgi:hypothetical protein